MAPKPQRPPASTDVHELERLREMDAFKTHFLNMAAHELNTPLTPLRLQLHLLLSGSLGPVDPRHRHSLEIASRNLGRLADLVKEILEVARLQGGGLRFAIQPFELDGVIHEAIEGYIDAAKGIGVDLQAHVPMGIVLDTDRNRVVQVLQNLVSNALKFTAAGGRVDVRARSEGDQVTIEVTDSGQGLAAEQIARLFQPFTQVHDPLKVTAPGTGLGLYICRGIVEAMGGAIACTSPGPGLGSTFTVVLPKTKAVVSAQLRPHASQVPVDTARRLRELI